MIWHSCQERALSQMGHPTVASVVQGTHGFKNVIQDFTDPMILSFSVVAYPHSKNILRTHWHLPCALERECGTCASFGGSAKKLTVQILPAKWAAGATRGA